MALSSIQLPDSSEGLEESEHVRTQLLRRVAHDIASPAGVTMTVLDELARTDRPRPELVVMAQRSVRRLMRLSEQLALVAELEAGALEPELAPSDLRGVLRRALDDAIAIDGRKEIAADFEAPEAPLLVACDAKLLVGALREVAGNALKLASSRVAVSVSAQERGAVIRVEDDGPGFSEEALATLGRRFVPRSSRGLGLSLSMAIELLRAHGGTLDVEPSSLPPGRRGAAGAAVVVSLPLGSGRPPPARQLP